MYKIKQRAIGWLDRHFTGESMDYKQIVAIIIPIFVDQAFLILMSFLNTAMISSSGVTAVSAVSMVDSLNIFLISVFISIATGGTVIVAQYKGSRNSTMVSKTATQAISVATLFSILISVLVILFHMPILSALFGNAEVEVFQNARVYLIGSCISYPFISIFQAVAGSLRGVGQTKPYLHLSLLMNGINTILNVLFITILDMGIVGLVCAVIIARVLGMIFSLVYLIKFDETISFKLKNALHLDYDIIKKIMYVGLPFAAEQVFFNGGKLLTQMFIVQLGTLSLTAYAIGGSISMLLQMGPSALAIAVVTVVGQSIGRQNIQDAKKFTRSMMRLSAILFIALAVLFLPLFPLMMKMFQAPDEIVGTIFILVLLSAITQPILWAQSFVLPSALRAAGDSKFTLITSLLSMWLIRVILGYILGIALGFGIIGVWVAMIIEWAVRGTVFLSRFKGKKWYSHRLI